MSGINPYASLFLQSLFSQGQGNPFSVQAIELLNLPSNMQNLTTPKSFEGQIVAQLSKGRATIETSNGERLDVKLKTQLPVGTKVELQIPSGKNISEGILQPSLARALNNVQEGQQQPVATQVQLNPNPLQIKSTDTIADVKNLQTTAQKATMSGGQVSLLNVGQSIRLSPLPASQQNMTSVQILAPQPMLKSPLNSLMTQPLPPVWGKSEDVGGLKVMSSYMNETIVRQGQTGQSSITQTSLRDITLSNQSATLPMSVKQSLLNQITLDGGAKQSGFIPHIQDARVVKIDLPLVQIKLSKVTSNILPPQSAITSDARATQMVVQSTGFQTVRGNPIVSLPISAAQMAFFEVNYPAQNLPAGTQITLENLPASAVKQSVAQQSMLPWKSMQDVLDYMLTQMPLAQRQSLLQAIPNVSQAKSFPAAALLFLAAAKGGDLSGWLGAPLMSAMQNAPLSIRKAFEKLTNEIIEGTVKGEARSDGGSPIPQQVTPDWRGYMMPMMFGNEVFKLPLWVHDQYGEDENGEQQKLSTRFVIDVHLSRMGSVQIDGIIRNQVKQFDMVIMTENEFSSAMRDHISAIWQTTLQSMDMRGSMDFRKVETV